MDRVGAGSLSDAYASGQLGPFDPYTGQPCEGGEANGYSPSQRLGLDVPRYCTLCGRRMIVQVMPTGWLARCSRHGAIDSAMLELR
ncbi:biotin synthase auxiliary protein BsaP [Corynebacterium heidelbergense]|uniref:biotin synthase auxiliary protein BsaP n=1 Tax=Corynebacterium heidelbergense TaxID=2055947 RepID=UPI003F6B3041